MIAFRLLLAASLLAGSFATYAQTPTPDAATSLPTPTPDAPVPAADTAPVAIPPAPASKGAAWLVMDFISGQVLAGENIDAPRAPASITKVMTSYVVAAELASGKIKKDDEVFISEKAWREGGAGTSGSFSGLDVNSKVKLADVLTGMIVQSGNDASIALAEHTAGSEQAFADLMNNYAKKLGMSNTNFVNSHGLDAEGHVSTARDIAMLGRALIRDFPEHYKLYSMREFTYNGITQHNRNNLLWKDASVDGIKTGHTDSAGYCLVASAKRGDQRLVSVVLGIEGSRNEGFRSRENDNLALLNWGFRFFETHSIYEADAKVADQKLWKGQANNIALGVAQPVRVTIPRGRYAALKPSIDIPKQLIAPINKGQQIGMLRIMLDDKPVVEQPIVALADVAQAGFFGRMYDEFWMWWESE